MAKNISMTRERKIALPVILEAADLYRRTLLGETPAFARNSVQRLTEALEKFK